MTNRWLRPVNFQGEITLPGNFNYALFDPFVIRLEKDELRTILGDTRLLSLTAWLIANPLGVTPVGNTVDIDKLALYKLVVGYLIYAVYAQYVFEGDTTPTDTGLVQKRREESDSLSDAMRMQLYRNYKEIATRRAADITDFLTPQTGCSTTSGGLVELRISSSRGRTSSATRNW